MNDTLLRAENVSFAYRPHQTPVIHGFSERFEAGSISAVVGPSGAGKSSLLYLLGLMLVPTSGEIIFDGVPSTVYSDRERSRLRSQRYGFVFQDAALDPRRTVIDNVLHPLAFRGESRNSWIDQAKQLLVELGVEIPLDRRPGEVSGGQTQRVALCRAVLTNPDVILADEPTGNLDPESTLIVINELTRRAREGATVIIVTHSREVEEHCDRTVVLTPSTFS